MNPLDGLAQAVTAVGWRAQLRTDGPVPLLRVWHPAMPLVGDSVSVRTGPDGVSRLHSSTGRELSPSDDVTAGRDAVIALLQPFVDRYHAGAVR